MEGSGTRASTVALALESTIKPTPPLTFDGRPLKRAIVISSTLGLRYNAMLSWPRQRRRRRRDKCSHSWAAIGLAIGLASQQVGRELAGAVRPHF